MLKGQRRRRRDRETGVITAGVSCLSVLPAVRHVGIWSPGRFSSRCGQRVMQRACNSSRRVFKRSRGRGHEASLLRYPLLK